MDKGRLFRFICGTMIAFIVVILVVVFVSDDDTASEISVDITKEYSDPAEWMSKLSDEKYLSEVTIPGTHNSAARNVALGYVMRCQNTSIAQQLENGYRYLDFRVALEDSTDGGEGKVKLVHNFASCHEDGGLFSDYLYFDDAVADVYTFLQHHQQEVVIINIKIEDDDHPIESIQKLILAQVKSNKDYWYTGDAIPTLEEARGRIVLATRFHDVGATGVTGLQMIWGEQDNNVPAEIPYELYVNDEFRLWVQDRYKYSVSDKYDAVVDGLENCEADENTLFYNFVSTSGEGFIGHPAGYAKALNGLLMEYNLKSSTSYGVIIVDFGTADLARHIYYSNF